ncbi:MAG: hypothetical protein H7319_16685 [Spirosoma sp.]|nr:hypothetical protein [Spirosoma sp.]
MKLYITPLARLVAVACLLLTKVAVPNVSAQDVIYFENGDPLPNTRITSIDDTKVVLTVGRDGDLKEHQFGRSRILLAFTKTGNYLLVSELSTNVEQARQQLQTFLNAPPRADGNDYLIKAVPLTVIPAQISYESAEVVNYKTTAGTVASIGKGELIGILYRDGRHLLTVMAGEAAPLLMEIRASLTPQGKAAEPPAPVVPFSQTTEKSPPSPALTEPATTGSLPEASVPSVKTPSGRVIALTEDEKENYRQQSLQRVEEFVAYISIITDKGRSNDEKDKAIGLAKKLFLPDATIEVTSANRVGSRQMPVGQYLNRLKLLPYTYTRIEWIQSRFVKDLTQSADGNYYGTIAGQQTFTGFGANGKVSYEDLTDKNVRVKLEARQTTIDGQEVDKWRILLGNVSVAAEQN